MNVLLFKRDLEKFSNKEIVSISKMYNLLGDTNDLRWMIAIKHSQKAPMIPVDDLTQRRILKNLDDRSLQSVCSIKGYADLCDAEYARRVRQYPNIPVQGSAKDTFQKILMLKELQEWLKSADKNIELDKIEDITYLSLVNKGIKTIPRSIKNLHKLTRLALGNNDIKEIPQEFGELNLTFLDLSKNGLSELPETIGELSNLRTLHLHGNNLSDLPESIKNLKNLQTLTLYRNPISKETIKNLKKILPDTKISK